ncbi:hypothetical protein MOUN0_I01002 [Monosporozyma unispora]|nr:hypothetical protein C6P44_002134 [Kazachstania unispora]
MKDLTGQSVFKLCGERQVLRDEEVGRLTPDIWELPNMKRHSRSLTEKNINVSSLFQKVRTTKKSTRQSQNEGCSQLFSQLSQNKPKQKSFSIGDLVYKSKRFHRQTNRITKPKPSKDSYSNFRTPLMVQLQKSVSNVNHKVRVSKLKKQFDILFRVKSIKKLSNNELLVIPAIENTELKYVLHVESNKPISDETICYHNKSWKVAIYSEFTIKLSQHTYWCLSWEFIK